ncbi:MAG TPA: AraC family transcriptional regulator [Planctomycetota bacterium]|nr:AraC family transcriptional regulator [Planctomycetota bacterium]
MAARVPRIDSIPLDSATRHAFDLSARQPMIVFPTVVPARGGTRFDMHYELEFGIVTRGRMRRIYRGHEIDLGPGEAWMCGIWEPHGYAALGGDCGAMVAVIAPAALTGPDPVEAGGVNWLAPFAVQPEHRPRPDPDGRERLLDIARRMDARARDDSPRRPLWLRLLLSEALLTLHDGWVAPPAADIAAHRDLQRAVRLVFDRRGDVRADEAAAAAGMGRARFDRAFAALMGLSFAQFALRHRIGGAAAQLRAGDDPIKSVARRWGFTDPSHLRRCFIQHYGRSPAVYRQRGAG